MRGGSDWAPLGPSARALSYLPFFPSPNGEKEATFLVWGNLLLPTVLVSGVLQRQVPPHLGVNSFIFWSLKKEFSNIYF